MKKVAILGTGPAGLMAAHACKLSGQPFHLFGLGQKSKLGGAQFLHVPVPMLNSDEPDFTITYRLAGDHTGYRQKVYGTGEIPFVSMQNVHDGQVQDAWSLERSYDLLWEDIAGGGNSINVGTVTPEMVIRWCTEGTFDLIVSTIPKHELCLSKQGMITEAHHFWSQSIRIMNRCVFDTDTTDNRIYYDGTRNVSWYRTSRINGIGSTEWGHGAPERLPYETFTVRKPINTTCTCFSDQVLFTGRFGAWKKGLLVHDAFVDTWKALKANTFGFDPYGNPVTEP